MNSPFKFLSRVRIHGGECGAVARALHHEVKGLSLYQADLEKSSGSTNERKQMSTKTTFKRIALVAVAALGFGVLTSVAPASAASVTPTLVTVGSVPVAQIGVIHKTPVTFTAPFAATTDTHVITVRIIAAPVGSAYASTIGNNKTAAGVACDGGGTNNWISATCY